MLDLTKKQSIEGFLSALCLTLLCLAILLQIFSRLLLTDPPLWTEQLARWLWIWMVMIGIAEVERTNNHLTADFLITKLPKYINQYIYITIDIVYLIVLMHLILIGYHGAVRKIHAQSITLPVSEVVLYASFPIAGLLIALRIILRVHYRIIHRVKKGAY